MLDIGVLCNPDKTTIVSHNHKTDGPELEHWDQSGASSAGIQTDSPSLSLSTPSSDNVFLPLWPAGAQQIRDSAESEHCVELNGAARSEKLRNKVLKTFELNNRMKLYTPSGRQETKLDSNNLVEFLNHLNIFYGHGKSSNKQNIYKIKPGFWWKHLIYPLKIGDLSSFHLSD